MSVINYGAQDLSKAWLVGGTLYAYLLDANDNKIGKARSLGFCDGIDMSSEVTKASLYASNFGPRTKVREVVTQTDVNLQIILRDTQIENIALALMGEASSTNAATGIVETHVAYKGGVVPVDYLIDLTSTTTVTAVGGTPSYTEGTDYVINDGSIFILETGSIVDGDDIEITYDSLATQEIAGFTQSAVNVGLYFEGENLAESGEKVKVEIFKVVLDPTDNYSILSSEDFVTLTLNGAVLASKSATGTSKYYREVRQAS